MAADDDELDPIDRDALERAMQAAARDPETAQQLAEMLKDDPWIEVAEYASYSAQIIALRLKPWQLTPSDPGADEDAIALHDRLLEAGLSIFEPDPMAALAKARRK